MIEVKYNSNSRYDRPATTSFVAKILRALDIEPGSTLLIQSAFAQLSRQGYSAEYFLEGLLSYLDGGTLALPTLSWREVSPSQPNWNERSTRSNVGILSEIFRTRYAERRSVHPTHSVAAVGPQTAFLLEDHACDVRPCSEQSPWGRLALTDAHILLMGVDMDNCTLVHHLEETRAPDIYLQDTVESYICEGSDSSSTVVKTRRHRKLYRNFYKFREILKHSGQLRIFAHNNYIIYGFKAADLVACVSREFDRTDSATLAMPGEHGKLM